MTARAGKNLRWQVNHTGTLGFVAAVVGVYRSGEHSFSKFSVDQVELIAGLGVAGDAHSGAQVRHRSRVRADPTQPNLRQVHLIHRELFDHVAGQGFTVTGGQVGENITTEGLDLLGLPVGSTLRLGQDALITITGLRNPCQQLDNFQDGLTGAMLDRDEDGNIVRLAGVMAVVIRSGIVNVGDEILVSLPPLPHHKLERV